MTAPRDIDIDFASGEARLKAHVRVEHKAFVTPLIERAPKYGGGQEYVRLLNANVKTKPAFTRFLDGYARETDELWAWCYRDVWRDLLRLLDVRPPFPDPVKWPPDRR